MIKMWFGNFIRVISVFALLAVLSATIRPALAAVCNDAVLNWITEGLSLDTQNAISGDGTFIVGRGNGRTLTDTTIHDDIYIVNRLTCAVELVSVATGGVQANEFSGNGSLSDDGRYVSFSSRATNLNANATNGIANVYVHDRTTGITTLVSRGLSGAQLDDHTFKTIISGEGRYVFYIASATNIVTGDTNGTTDIFRYDMQTSTTIRVSVATDGTQRNAPVYLNDVSPDGNFVLFHTNSAFVADDLNVKSDVYLRDINAGTTTRVSLTDSDGEINNESQNGSISANGGYIAFTSIGVNVTADDTNSFRDVFVRDRLANTTTRVSRPNSGAMATGISDYPRISRDGRFVLFESEAPNLILGDGNNFNDIFLHDRQTVQTTRVSRPASTTPPNNSSYRPMLSGNGNIVAFSSDASNLVSNDTNNQTDVFAGDLRLLGQVNLLKNADFSNPTIGDANNGWGVFATAANGTPGDFIDYRVQDGIFEFYRKLGGGSAVVLQNTGIAIPTNTTMSAYMELGNTSQQRKRILAMLHSSDFSDLQVCVFWLEPNTSNAPYVIESYTTLAWSNVSLSLYASPATDQGYIQVDNVDMTWNPGGLLNETICSEPISLGGEPQPDSGNLIDNGDFTNQTLGTPINGWGGFATAADGTPDINFLAYQFNAGVFEFYRKTGGGSAVILQNTETPIIGFDAVEIVMQIGNSGNARKRLLVMMHDGDFQDLQICSFWIQPNTTLGQHIMISWTTKDWTNAHLSLYASPATDIGWIQVDNIVMRHRPALIPVGTECYGVGAMPLNIEERLVAVPLIAPTLEPTATGLAPYAPEGFAPELPIMPTQATPEAPSADEGSIGE